MRPVFQILANNQDVTAKIKDRLTTMTVTDEDGYSADTLTLSIDNRDSVVDVPETDVALDVSLGYAETGLTYIGRFVVDRVIGEGPPLKITVEATAANMVRGLRAPKTRAWEGATLEQIVSDIASGAGLATAISASLKSATWSFVAQSAESDLNLLTRLCRELDATAKPAGGALVVVKRGEGVNAQGDTIPSVPIPVTDLSSFTWSNTERKIYKSVEAQWGDIDGADQRVITAGSGEPTRRLRHVFYTADEAQRAANAELQIAGREGFKLSGNLHRFAPSLFAGGTAEISGLQEGVDGTFFVRKVTHTLNNSLTTEFAAERAI